MTVACPECRSVFRVDPGKVPVSGVRARCAVCGGVIAIAGGTLPVSVSGGGAPVREWADDGWPPAPPMAAPMAAPIATPARDAEPLAPVAAPLAPVLPPPVAPTPVAPPPVISTPVVPPPVVPPPVVSTPVVPPPVVPRQPTPAYSDIPVSFPVFGRTHTPASVPAVPAPSPAFAMPAGGVGAAAPVAPPVAPPAPTERGGAVEKPVERLVETATAARPSINPFLRSDPEARARRLARALVSDLVAYHPQRREEGVREGTLRQLFRDDIRKSYEEYVEQVGRELAERTRYFQDALNDILAGGRALF